MKDNNFVFIFDAHLPYVRNEIEEGGIEEDWLFDMMSYTLLPMLKICENLKKDTEFKMGIVFEPILCEMLADKLLQNRYRAYLNKKIEFAKKELEKFSDCKTTKKVIQYSLKLFTDNKRVFEDCGGNILHHFDSLAKAGYIEILATTATSCFLPFFEEIPEAISAQIEMGQVSYRKFFSSIPSGFWLPALAYKEGLDEIIRNYGYEYTIVESKAFLLANKMPPSGVFGPAVSEAGLKFLATDACAYRYIYDVLSKNSVYLDVENDVGFKYDCDYLSSVFDTKSGRRGIGFRYWSKEDGEKLYDIDLAMKQIEIDARNFVNDRKNVLKEVHNDISYKSPTSVLVLSSDFFGVKWSEGLRWFEQVFKNINNDSEIKTLLPVKVANISKQLYTVNPFFSSNFESGYASELLNNESDWMYCFILKTTKKMIDLVRMFPKGDSLIERILNAAAREVILLQSYYWQFYAGTNEFREFAEKRFIDHFEAFSQAYEALGADSPDTRWLTSRESKFPIFKDINYRIFSKKE